MPSTHPPRPVDLRERVVDELLRRKGSLGRVARESKVPYDTVISTMRREREPLYSTIRALADYFGFDLEPEKPAAEQQPQA